MLPARWRINRLKRTSVGVLMRDRVMAKMLVSGACGFHGRLRARNRAMAKKKTLRACDALVGRGRGGGRWVRRTRAVR